MRKRLEEKKLKGKEKRKGSVEENETLK